MKKMKMKRKKKENEKEEKKRICRFIEVSNENDQKSSNDSQLKRFIILNFHGIYNFTLKSLNKVRLNVKIQIAWNDFSRVYTIKYFLVTQYKNDVQSLEVYNLEKMELETIAKRVENKDEFVNHYYSEIISISRLQLGFIRGINIIKLYYIENGLQIASKKFDEIEQIYSLEFIENDEKLLIIGKSLEGGLIFIIWDLCDTGKAEPIKLDNFPNIENLDTRLARTS
ncbi:hypothetical protein C1646_819585 [Rhizophagus diaphanus]|nr:hypothetical protein C1646_819585 [Rhizophagus diaphanus] [Rhizophagus sp. MUCL 43196]